MQDVYYNMKVKAKELIFDQKIALYDLEKETKNTKIIIFKQELNSEVVEIRQMYLVFCLPSMVASREKIIRIGQKVEFVITNLAKAALLGGIALTTHSLF